MVQTVLNRPGYLKPAGPLTVAEQHALLAKWLVEWPFPAVLLKMKMPGTLQRAHYTGCTRDEIHQACLTGAVRAARVFDPSRGIPFQGIALHYMRDEVNSLSWREDRDHVRRNGRHLGSLSDDMPGGDRMSDKAAGPPEIDPSEVEQRDRLAAAVMEVLHTRVDCPNARLVLELRWGLGGQDPLTYQAIGDRIGRSKEWVRQIEKVVKRKCRTGFAALYRTYCEK